MAGVMINLSDRDTKRWFTALSCLIKELEALDKKEVTEVLAKFKAEILIREKAEDGHSGLGLEFPEGYKIPQELV